MAGRRGLPATFMIVLAFVWTLAPLRGQEVVDDFGSATRRWELQPGWAVVSEGSNRVLEGAGTSFAVLRGDATVQSLGLRVKLLAGTVHLNLRTSTGRGGFSRYFVGLTPRASYLKKQQGERFQELARGEGVPLGRWVTIRAEVVENRIAVDLGGVPLLAANDPSPLLAGGLSFETLPDSRVRLDDVRVTFVASSGGGSQVDAAQLFPRGVHKGPITLTGSQVLTLQNGSFQQFGNFYLKDDSRLSLRNATLKIARYQQNLNHWGIYLTERATLDTLGSTMVSDPDTLIEIRASHQSTVTMQDSPSKVHLFSVFNAAKAKVVRSDLVGTIGGAVAANLNADVEIVSSKVGAIGLNIPKGAVFQVDGLRTGYFKSWSLQHDAKLSGIHYDIRLQDAELVPDTMGPGPYERGWPVFIDSTARVRITNSELRKVVLDMRDEKATFSHLALDRPTHFVYKDITLDNVRVTGQWGVFLRGTSDVRVTDSEGFWTFLYDRSKLTLENTHMDEFDPRKFHGEIRFVNSRWDTAAEILDGNDFVMRGSLVIGKIGGFSWVSSKVTRFYDVAWAPDSHLTLRQGSQVVWQGVTDGAGHATFPIAFHDGNYKQQWQLTDDGGQAVTVGFFSATPVRPGGS